MKRLVIIFSMFLALNVTAKTQITAEDYSTMNIEYVIFENEMFDIEQVVFEDFYNIVVEVNVSDINVVELEEEVEINNVSDINVVELEEEVEINFDTKNNLPHGFNAYEGMLMKECI